MSKPGHHAMEQLLLPERAITVPSSPTFSFAPGCTGTAPQGDRRAVAVEPAAGEVVGGDAEVRGAVRRRDDQRVVERIANREGGPEHPGPPMFTLLTRQASEQPNARTQRFEATTDWHCRYARSNRSSPSFSTLQAILSPALSHTCLSSGLPVMTPSGVPVEMRSPGCSVKTCEQ